MGGMNRRRDLFVLAASSLVLAAAVFATPGTAEACSPPQCSAKALSVDGQYLPTQVRAIPIPSSATEENTELHLGAAIVATTITTLDNGERVLMPLVPLKDGAYMVTYPDSCTRKPSAAIFDVGVGAADPE